MICSMQATDERIAEVERELQTLKKRRKEIMRASKVLIEALKGFESCHLKAYKCPAGVWTIGWGHTKGVKEGQVITQGQADSLLDGDLLSFVTHVNKLGLRLTQGQFDALVDFAYNCGTGNLDKSTLLRKVRVNAPLSEI